MRFAIISDIHGNLPALDAVLEDANNIDNFIFVGDYCLTPLYNFIHDIQMTKALISETLQKHLT